MERIDEKKYPSWSQATMDSYNAMARELLALRQSQERMRLALEEACDTLNRGDKPDFMWYKEARAALAGEKE